MFSKIRKRDGTIQNFDVDKITDAIAKAGKASGEFGRDEAERLCTRVLAIACNTIRTEVAEVEAIQDLVEEVLLASTWRRTAKAYIIYRDQHARQRDIARAAQMDMIDSYLGKLDWQVNENANMAFSLQGLNNYAASEVTKTYWLSRIYPPEIRQAHEGGAMHIHDLNLLAIYCVGWDLADLLTQGFRGAPGKVESGPARHFRSALGQIVNFFYTLQGEAAGAQAFSSLDTYLAPFIRADGLDYKEVKQALQEFIFNLNVPTRVGFQTPFTNVTLDLVPPSMMTNEPVILGGERQETTYGDYQVEMDVFNRAFLEVMSEGDAKGRVFTFPIPTYNIAPEFDYDDPRHEYLWKVTARYGIPYFANFVNSSLKPEDARSMCCRLRLDTRKLERRGGGLFGSSPLTGSVGVVTVNLPRIGSQARGGGESAFFAQLDRVMDLARDSLELKRKLLERLTDGNLYPYAKHYLRNIKERTGTYWHNHFATIGLVGLNEALTNFMGQDLATAEGRAFGLRVLDHMRSRLGTYQDQTGHFYNLEATPAEGTSYRLAMLDKKLDLSIFCANEADWRQGAEPYYTNSSQLPVGWSQDVFAVLDHQDEFQAAYTGGTVVHCFAGECIDDWRSVKEFVRTTCTRYRLPYFTVTPTFSICPSHGYMAGEHPQCPRCQSDCEVYSRIVGYLRPVQQWNKGKKAEFAKRASFTIQGATEA